MLLTSLNRARLALSGLDDDLLDANLANDRVITQWISTTSSQIEQYLNRLVELTSRVEYFDIDQSMVEFFPRAIGVSSITSLKNDLTGLYDGSESTLSSDEYFIGADSRSIVTSYQLTTGKKALKLTYVGGMATHAVNSKVDFASVSNNPTATKYVKGSVSGAIGIVNAWDLANLRVTIEGYYGLFVVGDIISQYDSEANAYNGTSGTVIGTITEFNETSLMQSAPALVEAVDIQIAFYRRNMTSFENAGVGKDGVQFSQRKTTMQVLPLLQEVRGLVMNYRRMRVGF